MFEHNSSIGYFYVIVVQHGKYQFTIYFLMFNLIKLIVKYLPIFSVFTCSWLSDRNAIHDVGRADGPPRVWKVYTRKRTKGNNDVAGMHVHE
jgi:hypothetical protein